MLRPRWLGPCIIAMFFLAGCNSEPQKTVSTQPVPAKAPTPAEPVTAREAFQKLYLTARQWAVDARPVRMESQPTSDGNGRDGKSAVWRTLFASPARHGIQAFVWSGSSASDAPERGISHGTEDTFNPNNASTQPFDMLYLKSDSDAAFTVAQKNGGEKMLKANATLPVVYQLDWDAHKNQLVWHVIYGASRLEAKLAIDVDATSGEFLRVEK